MSKVHKYVGDLKAVIYCEWCGAQPSQNKPGCSALPTIDTKEVEKRAVEAYKQAQADVQKGTLLVLQ